MKFGVLASAATSRGEVVPFSEPPERRSSRRPRRATKSSFLDEPSDEPSPSQRRRWAWVLAHTFGAELEGCKECCGRMRWVNVAKTAPVLLRA